MASKWLALIADEALLCLQIPYLHTVQVALQAGWLCKTILPWRLCVAEEGCLTFACIQNSIQALPLQTSSYVGASP